MNEPIISADGHVSDSPEMWARIPEPFREAAKTRAKKRDDGSLRLSLMGCDIVVPPPAVEMDDELRAKEFRNDPTGGTDLAVRTQKQLRDGVFAPEPERYVAAAFVPVDDVKLAVAEAERCIAQGFKTVMLPCSYPWRPYAIFAGNAARIYGFDLAAIGARIDVLAA